MKSKKYTRQIQLKKGAIRQGVQSSTVHVPETEEEWMAAKTQAADVRLRLTQIIESAGERLKGFPGTQEAYQITPDGGWVSVEAELAEGRKISHWQRGYSPDSELLGTGPALPIEPASPQEFAWFARDAAESALKALDDADMIRAVSNAMDAVSDWHRMLFGLNDELAVAIKRDGDEVLNENKGRRLHAAVAALQDWFAREHPGQTFGKRWRLIPEGDSYIELAGFRVSRGEYADPASGEVRDRDCLLIENMSDGTLESKPRDTVYRVCCDIA